MSSYTYGQIRDFVFHMNFQNAATQTVNNFDVALGINTAQYEAVASMTIPMLTRDTTITPASPASVFNFATEIKKIYSVVGFKSEQDLTGTELVQKYATPVPYEINPTHEYQYQTFGNQVLTGDLWYKLTLNGELFLPDIQDVETDWAKVFPLSNYIASVIIERTNAFVLPIKITDGYNVADWHQKRYEEMKNIQSKVYGNISGVQSIKNTL